MQPNFNQVVPLSFEGTHFQLVDVDGTVWVRGIQIAQALGYKNPGVAIRNLFTRNAGEFTEAMTMLVPVVDLHNQSGYADPTLNRQVDDADTPLDSQVGSPGSTGQTREVRLFSPRGAHLLAIFARTKRAAAFRHWVLDVLENATLATEPEELTAMQELRLITKSIQLMDRIEACKSLERAEEMYLRLMKVNRRLGLQTMAFSSLALSWRQGELDLKGGEPAPPAGAGH